MGGRSQDMALVSFRPLAGVRLLGAPTGRGTSRSCGWARARPGWRARPWPEPRSLAGRAALAPPESQDGVVLGRVFCGRAAEREGRAREAARLDGRASRSGTRRQRAAPPPPGRNPCVPAGGTGLPPRTMSAGPSPRDPRAPSSAPRRACGSRCACLARSIDGSCDSVGIRRLGGRHRRHRPRSSAEREPWGGRGAAGASLGPLRRCRTAGAKPRPRRQLIPCERGAPRAPPHPPGPWCARRPACS
jgi:hypothetical protein